MVIVKMSTKGQIVVPSGIREKYGIAPRSEIEVLDFGKEILLVPITAKDPIRAARGLLKFRRPVAAVLSDARKEETGKERGLPTTI